MNAIVRNKKGITLVALVTFIWLAGISNAPLQAAAENDSSSPYAVEKASPVKSVVKKKSILPLVLIGVGAIAALAAVYFLVIKKDKERVHDDFDSAADPLWLPRTSSAWSVVAPTAGTTPIASTTPLPTTTEKSRRCWDQPLEHHTGSAHRPARGIRSACSSGTPSVIAPARPRSCEQWCRCC